MDETSEEDGGNRAEYGLTQRPSSDWRSGTRSQQNDADEFFGPTVTRR